MKNRIETISTFLKKEKTANPKNAIILGSGLGNLVNSMEKEKEIPYSDIPGYPISTVKGHRGTLIFGKLNGVDVIVLNGRFHYYEGYTMKEVALPVHILKELGIQNLILSNAAGGMNPSFKTGEVMVIKDHINLFGTNPLVGTNDDTLGPRFPDMHNAYYKPFIELAHRIARQENFHLQEGVYMGVSGPCFETPAEYKMFYMMGADAVGMSTVPETIVARYHGIQVFAVSVITDLGIVGMVEKVSHEEVLNAAHFAAPFMKKLICGMLIEM